MQNRQHLLIIDPQNDFCDLPQSYLPQIGNGEVFAPSLPVTGAHEDMLRIGRLIDTLGSQLDAITVTLDSHHVLDIAHPSFWCTHNGDAVTPFTEITLQQVREGVYQTRSPQAQARAEEYLAQLEAAGRYRLMIWPVHCEIGSWGHNVHTEVRNAYNRWEQAQQKVVAKVYKGSNPWTEHYSAMMAEVPDQTDTHTQLNRELLEALQAYDTVLICGEASSHCVKASTEHIVAHWDPAKLSQLVLLTDCMSPVPGFEVQAQSFIEEMRSKGLRISTATEMMSSL
ncbi:cysteine hydrolase [Undibacterium cyanobacteriorum]|uniref:Cysteine hydrolase n=1 Tax=Undibacterium cyanobacteriorum TaxID=3073561 RepID=A0ABY9RGF9_9BURK|nr:cysteine hydrolase [Undibacterium sp. 20NA77.5]WMW80303.1 cysteine hydrolase [Undibacterium sp. 20NA77.5]